MAYKIQGGVKNYLGKQKEVKAPLHWQSSPDHPKTELAYITKAEKDLLIKSDLHGSLKGGVNKGPSGIMSLNGWGSKDESGKEVGMSGTATSAAETGSRNARDVRDVQAQMGTANLGPGVMPEQAQEYRDAAIAAGAGQTVNPGFFGPRNRVSKEALARARAFSPAAYRATRGSRFGLGNILGGLAGLVMGIPGLGFGINALKNFSGFGGKDEEDMSEYNELGLYTDRVNPTYYNDLGNEFALGTTSDPYRMSVGTTQGNTLDSSPLSIFNTNYPGANKGIPYTNAFTQAGTMDYLNDYTNQLEKGQPITDDEQMFVDKEIANLRFP